ncbi:MAG: helix-turn-helix domain-containing protein [Gallionellaceae bacterium]|jgi:DNA-binding IclR family transcriptional regulator
MATKSNQSATKAFAVLDVLWRNFASGYTPGELAKATGLSASNITGYVKTLVEAGYAERIPETGHIRVSVQAARKALQVMQSLDTEERRVTEIRNRLLTVA